jgi:hypothetical protein
VLIDKLFEVGVVDTKKRREEGSGLEKVEDMGELLGDFFRKCFGVR